MKNNNKKTKMQKFNTRIDYPEFKLGAAPILFQVLLTESVAIMAILSLLESAFFIGFYILVTLAMLVIAYNNYKYFNVKYLSLVYISIFVVMLLGIIVRFSACI